MAYTDKQIYFEITPIGDGSIASMDTWITKFKSIAVAAGMTATDIPSNISYLTTAEETAFPPPSHVLDGDYMVFESENALSPILVIGDPLGEYVPTPTPTTVIETGSRSIPALHGGIVEAILLMHPSWKAISISDAETMFITETKSNVARPVPQPANFLFTDPTTLISHGGCLVTGVPSTRTFNKLIGAAYVPTVYGENNYFQMFVHVNTRIISQSLNFDFSRDFASVTDINNETILYPPVTSASVKVTAGPIFETLSAGKCVGFINKHAFLCHRVDVPNQFLLASGLKLIDLRTALTQDVPIATALYSGGSKPALGGGSGVSLNQAPYAQGVALLQINSTRRYCNDHNEEPSSGFHFPLYAQAHEGAIAVWEGDTGEAYDAWVGFDADPNGDHSGVGSIHSPYFSQMHDAMLFSSRRVSNPTFDWDGQSWRVTSDSLSLPYTLAMRYTDEMLL